MIGTQPTGAIEGVVITAVSHEGLTVTVNGRPARLAIIADDGQIVASGDQVAREAEAVAVNCYKQTMQGKGYMRVLSNPISCTRDAQTSLPVAMPRIRSQSTAD